MKNALVTGGIGGMGTAITRKLVTAGYQVIVTHLPAETDIAKKWLVENRYGDEPVKLLALDVSRTADCEEILTALLQRMGHIDVLINNAGITRDATFKRMSAEQWHDVININLNSLYNVTHPLFPAMCENEYGRIINITSVNGLKGQFGQTNYSAAKAGMIGFTKALAAEGAKNGVTVNAVAPGYTGTPMVEAIKPEVLQGIKQEIPMQRLAQPAEIAAAVAFLASDDAGYITGETVSVNGGLFMH
jgi:acetoacetyl-CoA reductase